MSSRAAIEAALVDAQNSIAEAEAHLAQMRAELPSLPQEMQPGAVELMATKAHVLQLLRDYNAQLASEFAGRDD
jgi:hypothetical protein